MAGDLANGRIYRDVGIISIVSGCRGLWPADVPLFHLIVYFVVRAYDRNLLFKSTSSSKLTAVPPKRSRALTA